MPTLCFVRHLMVPSRKATKMLFKGLCKLQKKIPNEISNITGCVSKLRGPQNSQNDSRESTIFRRLKHLSIFLAWLDGPQKFRLLPISIPPKCCEQFNHESQVRCFSNPKTMNFSIQRCESRHDFWACFRNLGHKHPRKPSHPQCTRHQKLGRTL